MLLWTNRETLLKNLRKARELLTHFFCCCWDPMGVRKRQNEENGLWITTLLSPHNLKLFLINNSYMIFNDYNFQIFVTFRISLWLHCLLLNFLLILITKARKNLFDSPGNRHIEMNVLWDFEELKDSSETVSPTTNPTTVGGRGFERMCDRRHILTLILFLFFT